MKADGLYNNSINQALINLDKIAIFKEIMVVLNKKIKNNLVYRKDVASCRRKQMVYWSSGKIVVSNIFSNSRTLIFFHIYNKGKIWKI
jgi:hypothetical protein